MKKLVCNLLEEKIAKTYEVTLPEIETYIEIPPEDALGDFSFPCFALAKQLKTNPKKIAEKLQISIENDSSVTWLEQIQIVGGYLNLFINREFFIDKVINEALDIACENFVLEEEKTICMDYSSPNIAKNFHVGHLRTTIIGNSLYKIYSKLGYKVIRINHLGDWGTQFGKLIVAYKLWSNKELVEQKGIEELLRIYIKFENEAEHDLALKDQARQWFANMEQGNEEALFIWNWFKELSLKEFERVYQILKVEFDSYHGESFYMDKVPALVEELREKNLLQESEGANIINLEEFGMPPCLITKKDGSSIYHSRDIAAALYRKKTYEFTQCLYITGMEQKLHFMQIFQALEVMGYTWARDCHHIPYGLVHMSGQKLSTRKGNIVYAEDILNESILRALQAIQEKNPELTNKEEVARKIGVGAVIFHDLANQLSKDVQFQWEAVLSFDGMTAPYIQYTFARANSILRKVGQIDEKIDVDLLTDDASYQLIKQISNYKEAIKEATRKYEPCIIARYVYCLAVQFNKFYQECRIVNEETKLKQARAMLTYITMRTIQNAMELLGIECPEEM